ncbi:MAG: molybdopterin-guanine dinucleotide biosynthesis protein B [Dehalococcoidia bacterium]
MPPLISIVGKSKSGKTLLLEKLIPELSERGYRVATLKHTAHGFEMDQEGKDTYRLSQAGSQTVAIVSPERLAVLYRHTDALGLERLPRFIVDSHHLLLVEGFSGQKATKIEVHRPELGDDLLCNPSEVWAVVSDAPLDVPVPRFSWDSIPALADTITRTFPLSHDEELELFINGRWVRTNPYVTQVMGRVLIAMASTLKGVEDIEEIDLRWKRHG